MEKVENNVKYQELIKYIKSLSDSELEEKIKKSIDTDSEYRFSLAFDKQIELRLVKEDVLCFLLIKKDSELSDLLIKPYITFQ